MQQKNTYGIVSKVLYRGKIAFERLNESYSRYVLYKLSRDSANRIRNRVISDTGIQIVDSKLLKKIKEYCSDSFGSSDYWPWLALYTELRGEFKEGWIPDDYYRFELLPKLNPERFMRFSEAKSIDHKLFGDMIVTPLFFRSNGKYLSRDRTILKESVFKKLIHDLNQEIIVKPESGRGGHGIKFFSPDNINLDALPSEQDLVFYEAVKQHPELNRLHPESINTFRVVTCVTPTGDIQILYVILRFGMGGSRVDNASSGGGCIYVQPNGAVVPHAYNGIGVSIGEKHPDTGVRYSDLRIPFYDEVITLCEEAHRKFTFTRLVGWDVYINEKAEPKLIEWNANNPAIWNEEALFGPFFEDLIND